MFFYIIHQIVNVLPMMAEWTESRKNCITLIIGLYLHFFFFIALEYIQGYSSNKIFELMRRFYLPFIFIDAFVMAIVYKCYWGRSILNETEDTDHRWDYDEQTHKYKRKLSQQQNLADQTNTFDINSSPVIDDNSPDLSEHNSETEDEEAEAMVEMTEAEVVLDEIEQEDID